MAQTVRDIMTTDLVSVKASQTVIDAARAMRDANIGDVLVMSDGEPFGIVTDRDIVVRAIAEGKDPSSTLVSDIASQELETVSPQDDAEEAVKKLRQRAIRRLPVMDGGRVVGILSIGDLAIQQDPESALADISEAPPNR